MERSMILLVVVAVTLSTVLSCPPDETAMEKEIQMCTGQNSAEHQGRAGQCLAITRMLKCIDTAMTGCEGVSYVEAERAKVDIAVQSLNAVYQLSCV